MRRNQRLPAMRWCLFGLVVTGSTLAAPFVPARDANCVAISADARLIAIGISGQSNSEFPPRPHPSPRKCGVVQLFDAMTKKRLRRMETFGDLTRVGFSPDGLLLAAARLFVTDEGIELNEVRVWDVATGKPKYVFDRCHAFSFAASREEIVVASRKRCVVFDTKAGTKVRELPPLADAVQLAHRPDDAEVAGIVQVAGGFGVRVSEANTGRLRAESPAFPEPFYSLTWTADGRAFATGHSHGTILWWDAASVQPQRRFTIGGTGRASPFISPTGEFLAAADQTNSDVVIWRMATGDEFARYSFKQGALPIYGDKSRQRILHPAEDPIRFVFTPDGEAFLGGPYGGILRLVNTGRDIARFGE